MVTSIQFVFRLAAFTDIPNYHGKEGSAPILVFNILLVIIFSSIIAYFAWLQYKKSQFEKICKDSNLSNREIGLLRGFSQRFHIENPLDLLTSQGQFNSLVNSVAHHLEHSELLEEDLNAEAELFYSIRNKLNFKSSFNSKNIYSSRSFPPGHPITITYFDRETKNKITFTSKVLHNNDLYLGIQPPKKSSNRDFLQQKKLGLQITLHKDSDAEYHFDSCLSHIVNIPKHMWYLRHSDSLTRGEEFQILNLSSTLMLKNQDEGLPIQEHNTIIKTLTRSDCTFTFNDSTIAVPPNSQVLITIHHNVIATWGGTVTSRAKKMGIYQYRMKFITFDNSDTLLFNKLKNQVDSKKLSKV